MTTPFVFGLGPTELLIILAVLVLLFGASKLPELARGSGRALRIFKAETKGLMDDDDRPEHREQPRDHRELGARDAGLSDFDADAERRRRNDTTS